MRPPKQLPPAVAGRELATWGSRVGAYFLELLIEFGVFLGLAAIVTIPTVLLWQASQAAGIVTLVVLSIPALIVLLLFQPYFMNRKGEHNGQTLGKQVVGITVVRDQGERMSFGWALLRQIVVIQMIPATINSFALVFFLPLGTVASLIDGLWPLWDDQDNRAVHDMIVSTHVVRT